jgi:hypothetical protein
MTSIRVYARQEYFILPWHLCWGKVFLHTYDTGKLSNCMHVWANQAVSLNIICDGSLPEILTMQYIDTGWILMLLLPINYPIIFWCNQSKILLQSGWAGASVATAKDPGSDAQERQHVPAFFGYNIQTKFEDIDIKLPVGIKVVHVVMAPAVLCMKICM